MADQEFINRSHGQQLRRLRESVESSEAVQDAVVDVVIEHSVGIRDLDARLSVVERDVTSRSRY
jgi:hypothetical protein